MIFHLLRAARGCDRVKGQVDFDRRLGIGQGGVVLPAGCE